MKATILHHIKKWLCLVGALLLVLSFTACGEGWQGFGEKDDTTDVNTDLLVIPGTGGPEDTLETFEGAVDYNQSVSHEGTDIYYIGTGARRDKIIVVDAGHQAQGSSAMEPVGPGSDEMKMEVSWGAEGKFSGPEHALNLTVALRLRDELIARGYSVVMIRETADVNISNKARAEIANKYNASAYVRIHANSYDDLSMRGAMTICQSASNPYPDCAATYEKSHLLSELILQTFCQATGMPQYELREMDNMTGTNWSRVPTTIVEMGFLSNETDDMTMATEYFKEKAAIGIADGLDRYFDIMDARAEAEADVSEEPAAPEAMG